MFKINISDVDEYEDHLKTFGNRAFPFASKETLNQSAFKAQALWRRDVNVKMITRNKFTERSILVDQARTLNVAQQQAIVGSTAQYMEAQEFGSTKTKKGSQGIPIATSFAAGQSQQNPRTKLPRKPNKLSNVRLRRRSSRGRNKKQRLLSKVQDAVQSGKRMIFHDFGRKKGIFKVVGGSRKSKRGWPQGARLRMLWDMSEDSVVIPRNPTLRPVVDRVEILMPDIYTKALRFQIQRLGLFK